MLHHHSHRIHISLLTEFSVAFDFDLQTLHYGVSFVVQRKHTVQLYQELRSFFGVEGDLKLTGGKKLNEIKRKTHTQATTRLTRPLKDFSCSGKPSSRFESLPPHIFEHLEHKQST